MHNYCLRNNVPLISGGTDFRAGTVISYVRGKTSCLNCQIDLNALALKAEIIRRTSCLQSPDPSVIMTNQITGAIMVSEGRCVLRSDLYGEPINGEIKFISDFESRGGVSRKNSICDCHERGLQKLELPSPERVKVEERDVNGRKITEVFLDGKKL